MSGCGNRSARWQTGGATPGVTVSPAVCNPTGPLHLEVRGGCQPCSVGCSAGVLGSIRTPPCSGVRWVQVLREGEGDEEAPRAGCSPSSPTSPSPSCCGTFELLWPPSHSALQDRSWCHGCDATGPKGALGCRSSGAPRKIPVT